MNTISQNLIKILLNESAQYGDRHDAAMALGSFCTEEVETALANLACNDSADEDLADACGESLAELWVCKGCITSSIFVKLVPAARITATATLKAMAPTLADNVENILNSKSHC